MKTTSQPPRTKQMQWCRKYACGLLVAAGMLLGALVFCGIYGVRILNPQYDDWLLGASDLTQHYIGWVFYRRTPWSFPIGLLEGLSASGPLSCMYTDSIPLFAIFFKLLSPILPETFQYAGLWGLFSFAMQGGLSALILRKCSKQPVFCLLGSLCMVLSPSVLQRLYGHDALGGHWVILLAIAIWAYQSHPWKHCATQPLLWAMVAAIAVLVHIYYLIMVCILLAGSLLTECLQNKRWAYAGVQFGATVLSATVVLYCIGAFYGQGDLAAGGLGIYSANMNALWNPQNSSALFKPLAMTSAGQWEGYAYLGAGLLLASVFAIAYVVWRAVRAKGLRGAARQLWKRYRWRGVAFVAMVLASYVIALSPVVTAGSHTLFTIPMPQKCWTLFSTFRATGRFLWVAQYLVGFFCLDMLARIGRQMGKRWNKRVGMAWMLSLTGVCAVLQAADMRTCMANKHASYRQTITYTPTCQDAAWEQLALDGVTEILITPVPADYLAHLNCLYDMVMLAWAHDCTLSVFHTARASYAAVEAYAKDAYTALETGGGRADVLYVFYPGTTPPAVPQLTIYQLDGYTVGRYTPA